MTRKPGIVLASLLCLAGCEQAPIPLLRPLPPVTSGTGAAPPRINGAVGSTDTARSAQLSVGRPDTLRVAGPRGQASGEPVSLDFADTDIREIATQILGNILKVNYTIDSGVHGTATLRTTTPLLTSQLLPALEALLAQNGAALLENGGIYRVAVAGGAATPGPGGAVPAGTTIAGSADVAGTVAVPLHFASADDLAKVLQPFATAGARIAPDGGHNVLLVSGDATTRQSLLSLIQAFDIDLLAGQSYALLPVTTGDAKDFATSLQDAFRGQGGAGLSGVVRVLPMARMNAVLVVTSQPRYLDDAKRIYQLVDRAKRETVRSWHVYYLQNSHSDDMAYLLQRAFTPNDVTAQPTSSQTGQGRPNPQTGFGGSTAPTPGTGATNNAVGATPGAGGPSAGGLTLGSGSLTSGGASTNAASSSVNPLLGGLDPGAGAGAGDGTSMRIIPNPQNNALLIYATGHEEDTIEAMLHKVDIMPLQVRIDATIAEVTLNDSLKYGTQFFFKSGGINGILNNTPGAVAVGNAVNTVLSTSFPGFVLAGAGAGGAPIALQALQDVTTVKVLSSPELLVLDNQPAHLQVGNLVPYLTGSSQSTVANSAVINSVNYQPTGVIMNVTPRVNSGGMVTLDVSQEVSGIDSSISTATTGIQSPTFTERQVTSRVVVQDGQTIGLAGLITDNVTKDNSGIPFLKDIPLLGILGGAQNNTRTRTELLILITPHVLHDQYDARAMTDNLRQDLINAAALPVELQLNRPSGSEDPNRRTRERLQQAAPKLGTW